MAYATPVVARAAAILNFFAEHPGQSFTFTDIVRALRLRRATCHSLLIGLVESGYLYRRMDKRFVFGPTIAAIGRAAEASVNLLQVAQPEAPVLADMRDRVCALGFQDANDIIVANASRHSSHRAVP